MAGTFHAYDAAAKKCGARTLLTADRVGAIEKGLIMSATMESSAVWQPMTAKRTGTKTRRRSLRGTDAERTTFCSPVRLGRLPG
jgi:hypothetical protein